MLRPGGAKISGTVMLAIAALAVAAISLAHPAPAFADCTQLSPWPSFRQAAPSARTVLIGTVTWTPGGRVNNRFTLRVDEVLRGSAPDEIEFQAFRSGAPQPICPEDSSLRVRRVGERLTLAYDAHLPGLRRTITAVAFVKPSRPDSFMLPAMERLSAAEVRAIAAAPPATDTSPSTGVDNAAAVPEPRTVLLWAAGLTAMVVLLLTSRLRGQRPVPR